MTHPLYTCRTDGDQYRITKLDSDLNVESTYLCSEAECQCPAFERRGKCRHLDMLPKFLTREAINTGWALDYDRGGWVRIADDTDSIQLSSVKLSNDPEPVCHSTGTALVEPSTSDLQDVAVARPLPPAHYPSWRRI